MSGDSHKANLRFLRDKKRLGPDFRSLWNNHLVPGFSTVYRYVLNDLPSQARRANRYVRPVTEMSRTGALVAFLFFASCRDNLDDPTWDRMKWSLWYGLLGGVTGRVSEEILDHFVHWSLKQNRSSHEDVGRQAAITQLLGIFHSLEQTGSAGLEGLYAELNEKATAEKEALQSLVQKTKEALAARGDVKARITPNEMRTVQSEVTRLRGLLEDSQNSEWTPVRGKREDIITLLDTRTKVVSAPQSIDMAEIEKDLTDKLRELKTEDVGKEDILWEVFLRETRGTLRYVKMQRATSSLKDKKAKIDEIYSMVRKSIDDILADLDLVMRQFDENRAQIMSLDMGASCLSHVYRAAIQAVKACNILLRYVDWTTLFELKDGSERLCQDVHQFERRKMKYYRRAQQYLRDRRAERFDEAQGTINAENRQIEVTDYEWHHHDRLARLVIVMHDALVKTDRPLGKEEEDAAFEAWRGELDALEESVKSEPYAFLIGFARAAESIYYMRAHTVLSGKEIHGSKGKDILHYADKAIKQYEQALQDYQDNRNTVSFQSLPAKNLSSFSLAQAYNACRNQAEVCVHVANLYVQTGQDDDPQAVAWREKGKGFAIQACALAREMALAKRDTCYKNAQKILMDLKYALYVEPAVRKCKKEGLLEDDIVHMHQLRLKHLVPTDIDRDPEYYVKRIEALRQAQQRTLNMLKVQQPSIDRDVLAYFQRVEKHGLLVLECMEQPGIQALFGASKFVAAMLNRTKKANETDFDKAINLLYSQSLEEIHGSNGKGKGKDIKAELKAILGKLAKSRLISEEMEAIEKGLAEKASGSTNGTTAMPFMETMRGLSPEEILQQLPTEMRKTLEEKGLMPSADEMKEAQQQLLPGLQAAMSDPKKMKELVEQLSEVTPP